MDAAPILFRVLMKKVTSLKRQASSHIVSNMLSVLLATTTHQGVNAESVEQVLQVSRKRIAKWITTIMKGEKFGGRSLKMRAELEVCTHI